MELVDLPISCVMAIWAHLGPLVTWKPVERNFKSDENPLVMGDLNLNLNMNLTLEGSIEILA
jgi:hypothetical protein